MKVHVIRAFSLIELLVVVAIMALLLAVAVPALTSIGGGTNLNRGGQMISDQITLARQEAVSRNRDMQVYLYRLNNEPNVGWKAISLARIEQTTNGPVTNAASRLLILPEGILISSNASLSPLLTANPTGTTNLPQYGSVQYTSFRIRANGSLQSGLGSSNNYLTLQNATASGDPPPNYYTIQVNALNGKVSVFRP